MRLTGPGNLPSIRIKHIGIGQGLQLLLQRPSLSVQLVGLVCNSISKRPGQNLFKVVLKKTCLSGVTNCGISCGSGRDIATSSKYNY
ncbi:hypothetical protein NQ317_010731 [Molorchus minor]|uniref:Uncharacterized protein n=1 Tax=Molorchus minor TaxID=1323400 RepID=A0ABQ9K8W0_9CUCU|nr:hypothetical protein NQ317_010731 [Molorchus minor]